VIQRPVPVRKGKTQTSENHADIRPLDTGSSCPSKSVWLSDASQKAKTLDSHVPSLKRKKLGEITPFLMRSEGFWTNEFFMKTHMPGLGSFAIDFLITLSSNQYKSQVIKQQVIIWSHSEFDLKKSPVEQMKH